MGTKEPVAQVASATEVSLGSVDESARERLQHELAAFKGQKVALAFSGGTDSTLLLTLLQKQQAEMAKGEGSGDNAGGVFPLYVATTMHPQGERAEAVKLCRALSVELTVVELDELPLIQDNPENRCYLCKRALMQKLKAKAESLGCSVLIDGTNSDDLLQYRPGLQALKELGIVSPLMRAGITKAQVRAILHELGQRVAMKPSSPCMATRFPYGTHLDKETMQALASAEDKIHALGFYNVRVRAYPHEKLLRLELDATSLTKAIEQRQQLLTILREISGYQHFSLDLEGFLSGSMDKDLCIPHTQR